MVSMSATHGMHLETTLVAKHSKYFLSLVQFTSDIFIHLIIFQDAFGTARTLKTVGNEATLLSASEFSLKDRWDQNETPSILPLFIHSTKSINPNDPNYFLRFLTNGFERMSKGVEMYCAETGGVVKVFALLHMVLGDLPGRCSISGLRCNIFASRCCSFCDALNSDIKRLSRTSEEPAPRNAYQMKSKARMLGTNPMSLNRDQDAVGFKWGLTHFSEIWNFPGVYVSNVLANDFMHCEIQGEGLKHFLKVPPEFPLSY